MLLVILAFAVPEAHTDAFLDNQVAAARVYLDHGALREYSCRAAETGALHGSSSFEAALRLQPGEAVFLEVSEYRDLAHQQQVQAKADADPRIDALFERFQTLVDLKRVVRGSFAQL